MSMNLIECGCCGHYHKPDFTGDCRDDSQRFTADQLEAESTRLNRDELSALELAFLDHMMVTAKWADARDEEGEPLDDSEFSEEARAELEADGLAFYRANAAHIHCDGAPQARDFGGAPKEREAAMAGHDFWLTRNRHGAGFWDGDWPEPAGEALDAAAKAAGEVDIHLGDDGLLHV